MERPCPLCGSVTSVLALGLPSTPLGDRFCNTRAEATGLNKYPLSVRSCSECGHLYVPYFSNPSESYSHYLFESSNSPGLVEAFNEIVGGIIARNKLSSESSVVDIGANDGSWLRCFSHINCQLIAVEPAPMPAQKAESHGINVINEYFSSQLLFRSGFLKSPPSVISMNFMFANTGSPLEILSDVCSVCSDSTIISIITGYHPAQLSVGMFDYIYHEHLSYFSAHDFLYLSSKLNLVVTHCRELPLKGGSLHVELKRKEFSDEEHCQMFKTILKRESWLDAPHLKQWNTVNLMIDKSRLLIRDHIDAAKNNGMKVVGYGASHSTTTLTYTLGIENDIDYIVDDNPNKHNLYSPGSGLLVKSSESLKDELKPLVVVLGWQHSDKIIFNLRKLQNDMHVVIPFPSYVKIDSLIERG